MQQTAMNSDELAKRLKGAATRSRLQTLVPETIGTSLRQRKITPAGAMDWLKQEGLSNQLDETTSKGKPRRWSDGAKRNVHSMVEVAERSSARQVVRRDVHVKCHACGRSVTRKSRQQRYCSDRCRQYGLRENKARTAIKNPVVGEGTRRVTNPPKKSNENNSLQSAKSRASIPFNVLGGYRWPNAVTVDGETLQKVVRAEIGGRQ